MGRRRKEDGEQSVVRRGKSKGSKQVEELLQHMDVEASPHLEQMSPAWQKLYAEISRTVR
ncbi:hypothetical protein RAC89_14535 [Paenibacillus sp. GD4]|uniref:hypothetical protein n=1 Tax=Paenibacillus sp. GD4 TaxID=3068890 RepID=UPI002796569D|nr:hypothetical protein [Paenibacillus sp. GD4]MDQ1911625.1 hypothetical protein [Paenibacillus sp. GD4]